MNRLAGKMRMQMLLVEYVQKIISVWKLDDQSLVQVKYIRKNKEYHVQLIDCLHINYRIWVGGDWGTLF